MLVVLCVYAGGAWAQSCAPNEHEFIYPKAVAALKNWEMTRRTVVADSVKGKVLTDFCTSGKWLSESGQIPSSEINEASSLVLNEYLDRAADPKKEGQTMNATMKNVFGSANIASPEIKRYGKLTIVYTLDVDSIRVREAVYGRVTTLLVDPGPARVEGFKTAKRLCTGDVKIDPAMEAKFKC